MTTEQLFMPRSLDANMLLQLEALGLAKSKIDEHGAISWVVLRQSDVQPDGSILVEQPHS